MRETATDKYAAEWHRAHELLESIESALADRQAPSDELTPNWGHAGDMVETTRRLEAVLAFLNGTEV
jgi:hypothetical protein